MSYLEIRAVFV